MDVPAVAVIREVPAVSWHPLRSSSSGRCGTRIGRPATGIVRDGDAGRQRQGRRDHGDVGWRRWTGIEPAVVGTPRPTALKAAEPTRCTDTSSGNLPDSCGSKAGGPMIARAEPMGEATRVTVPWTGASGDLSALALGLSVVRGRTGAPYAGLRDGR